MLVTVAAAWLGLSLPISVGVGRLIRRRFALEEIATHTTSRAPTFAELYKRAFPTAAVASAYPNGSDAVTRTVSVCLN